MSETGDGSLGPHVWSSMRGPGFAGKLASHGTQLAGWPAALLRARVACPP